METQLARKTSAENKIERHLGFYSSLTAFIAAAGYCIAQILQLGKVITFPSDAYLIYGFSFAIAVPYVVAVIALHHLLPSHRRIWTHVALVFAMMYATYVNLNYVVQLTTVIPAARQGSLHEIRVLDQTPHSLFWDIDALGYICMGISTLSLTFAFPKKNKWLRTILFANGLMVPVIAFVYFYPSFSTAILLIGAPWMVTAPGSLLLLALFFRSTKTLSDARNEGKKNMGNRKRDRQHIQRKRSVSLKGITSAIVFLFVVTTAAAQKSASIAFKTGANFPMKDPAGLRLNRGGGFEATGAYKCMAHLEAYAGWGWQTFNEKATGTSPNRQVRQAGYRFGLRFVHPLSSRAKLNYMIGGGGIYDGIEIRNNHGDIIDDTRYCLGWQADAGILIPVGHDNHWQIMPTIRYGELSGELDSNQEKRKVDLHCVSPGVSVIWTVWTTM